MTSISFGAQQGYAMAMQKSILEMVDYDTEKYQMNNINVFSPVQEPVFPKKQSRKTGRVKFFDSQKGYGFIIPDDPFERNSVGKNEIFVHHTAIINDREFKSLAEGEFVEYDLTDGPNGLQAGNVSGPNGARVIGDPAAPTFWKKSLEMNLLETDSRNPSIYEDNSMPYPEHLLKYLYVIGVLSPSVMCKNEIPTGGKESNFKNRYFDEIE